MDKYTKKTIRNELQLRNELLLKVIDIFEKISTKEPVAEGAFEIKAIKGKEEDFNRIGKIVRSEGDKRTLLFALLDTRIEAGGRNIAVDRATKLLNEEQRGTIYPDFKESKENYIEVLGEKVECPSEMTPKEFLDYCNIALTNARANNKIHIEDLNPDFYKDLERTR